MHHFPLKTSISTIKAICYPSLLKLKAAATDWGCQHETGAVDSYTNIIKHKYTGLKIFKSGLKIDDQIPYLGAIQIHWCLPTAVAKEYWK